MSAGVTDVRAAWRLAYGQWRRARRNLLADGAIQTAGEALSMMRALSGNWDAPTPASYWIEQSRLVMRNGAVVCHHWHGPYATGRRFLARA